MCCSYRILRSLARALCIVKEKTKKFILVLIVTSAMRCDAVQNQSINQSIDDVDATSTLA
jgi:succinyl-CoA synthetase beta subunit